MNSARRGRRSGCCPGTPASAGREGGVLPGAGLRAPRRRRGEDRSPATDPAPLHPTLAPPLPRRCCENERPPLGGGFASSSLLKKEVSKLTPLTRCRTLWYLFHYEQH